MALRGEVTVDLVGRVAIVHDRLSARFNEVPDVPIRRVVLRFAAGGAGWWAWPTGCALSEPVPQPLPH